MIKTLDETEARQMGMALQQIDDAHHVLDVYRAPRTHPDDGTCYLTVAGRIHALMNQREVPDAE